MGQSKHMEAMAVMVALLAAAGCQSGGSGPTASGPAPGTILGNKPATQPIDQRPPTAHQARDLSLAKARNHAAERQSDQPSLEGLDRSDWPKVTFTVPVGRTMHHPAYFDSLPEPQTPNAEAVIAPTPTDMAPRMGALAGHHAAGWSGHNAARLAVEPARFGWDLITWPVAAIKTPPWQRVATPPASARGSAK
jgi:hypothetical protein